MYLMWGAASFDPGKAIREAGTKALEVCQVIGAQRVVRGVLEQMNR
jgi:hypothetical protein